MVETFAESAVRSAARVPVVLEASDDEELLVALLDEIVFLVDVRGVVPVEVRLEEGEGGSVAGWFDTVSVSDVESVGAAPKGVSRSELIFEQEDSRWRCRAMLDV